MQEKQTTLREVPFGERVRVRALLHDEGTRVRLIELGLIPGAEVRLIRRAPLGCPVEVDVSGTRFSIRGDVLAAVVVERAP